MAKSSNSAESRPPLATYHLAVVGIVCLLNEWEFLPSQCLEDGHHLGKLQKTRKNFTVSSTSGPDTTSVCQVNTEHFHCRRRCVKSTGSTEKGKVHVISRIYALVEEGKEKASIHWGPT